MRARPRGLGDRRGIVGIGLLDVLVGCAANGLHAEGAGSRRGSQLQLGPSSLVVSLSRREVGRGQPGQQLAGADRVAKSHRELDDAAGRGGQDPVLSRRVGLDDGRGCYSLGEVRIRDRSNDQARAERRAGGNVDLVAVDDKGGSGFRRGRRMMSASRERRHDDARHDQLSIERQTTDAAATRCLDRVRRHCKNP